MELMNLILDFIRGRTPGFFRLLNAIHRDVLGDLAERMGIDVSILFAIGLCAAVLCGVLAYRFVKFFLALFAAGFGYFVGVQIYFCVQTETMSGWVSYLFGAVLAILFFCLAYGRASYIWYAAVAILGYCATRIYVADDLLVALGGAFALALISIAFFRVVYIVLTSLGCGILTLSFLSPLLPRVEGLRLEPKNYTFWAIALLIAAAFALVQIRIARRHRA